MSRTWPVVEMFGPTIQGEGPAQGERCWFLRLGGCDYRCSWCDSMRAVDPAQVREAPRLDMLEIAARLERLGLDQRGLLILSGGNPALHHLDDLVGHLAQRGVRLHVETQGTVRRDWLDQCELVVVSPKPPSAFSTPEAIGAAGAGIGDYPGAWQQAERGLGAARQFVAGLRAPWALKVVAFDAGDLDWAVRAHRLLVEPDRFVPPVGCYLSAGTPQDNVKGSFPDALIHDVVRSFAWLAEEHTKRPELGVYRVGLQAHVLAWPGEDER